MINDDGNGLISQSSIFTCFCFCFVLFFGFFFFFFILKGHCHGDFVIFSSKWLKYLTKNLFSNMKLLLEHREGNIKGFIRGRTNYKQFLDDFSTVHRRNLKKLANFFKLQSISILAIPSKR